MAWWATRTRLIISKTRIETQSICRRLDFVSFLASWCCLAQIFATLSSMKIFVDFMINITIVAGETLRRPPTTPASTSKLNFASSSAVQMLLMLLFVCAICKFQIANVVLRYRTENLSSACGDTLIFPDKLLILWWWKWVRCCMCLHSRQILGWAWASNFQLFNIATRYSMMRLWWVLARGCRRHIKFFRETLS